MQDNLYRVALGIQYDGTGFLGWQSQLHKNTVQDVLQAAILKFIGGKLDDTFRVTVAGRTDTGVHALGQVVHFDTSINRPMWSWIRGINTYLPSTVSVEWAKEVPFDFHSRFSAHERSYAYVLVSSAVKIPLLNKKAGYVMLPFGKSLDLQAMRKGAQYLIGEQDFSCFRSSECQSKTPIKTVYQVNIVEEDKRLYFFLRANAFLHHMVRNIVGSLIEVGKGRQSPEWIAYLIKQRSRKIAAPTFSADGLYLVKVQYPNNFEIPEPNLGYSVIPPHLLELAFSDRLDNPNQV
jgi:tRNA pseudouridine38-40 synthase